MILKNIENSRMSLTVRRVEQQSEEIVEERPLRDNEDFYSFHTGGDNIENSGTPVPKEDLLEKKKQMNNPFAKFKNEPVNETKKNINAGGFSFGISIKKSY